MRALLVLTLAGAGLAAMESAAADTLRCGSTLIEPGDDAAYVYEKCVESASAETNIQGAWLGGASNPLLYPIGFAQSQCRPSRP